MYTLSNVIQVHTFSIRQVMPGWIYICNSVSMSVFQTILQTQVYYILLFDYQQKPSVVSITISSSTTTIVYIV